MQERLPYMAKFPVLSESLWLFLSGQALSKD